MLRKTALRRSVVLALSAGALVLGIGISFNPGSATLAQDPAPACNDQAPQLFLIRGNFSNPDRHPEELRASRRELHQKAIRYRTEQYGYFAPFGNAAWNENSPRHFAASAEFMGLSVRLHRRIIPAVSCAEAEIRRACTDHPYEPERLSGIRTENSYHNGEVSNHVYGIAIDIDPMRNTCCGCVAKWRAHPLCKRQVSSIYERMAMPECWVHAFERYGFYWLGHDDLRDTMHFEFLGDPDRIVQR